MIEELNRKIDIVIEGLESVRKELRREIDSFRTEANARFDIVEAAIRVNAQGIRDLQARMDRMESHHENQTARITKLEGIA